MLPKVLATDLYVSPLGANVIPFTNWSSAATNIQDAINSAGSGDTVWVTNGVYDSGGVVVSGSLLTNRVAITKSLTVRSVNGPGETIIEGFTADSTNGTDSIRCVWIGTGATLSGFTITGGTIRTSGSNSNLNGGGLFCQSSNAIITNCVIVGNSSVAGAGGVYQGTLWNCLLSNNATAGNGGGTFAANLYHCIIAVNSAGAAGGNAYKSVLEGCEVSANISGGGASFCTIKSSKILNNNSYGVQNSFLQGCFLKGNSNYAAFSSTNLNCTFVGNHAAVSGGLSTNCIIWFNTSSGSGRKIHCVIQPETYFSSQDYEISRLFPNLLRDGLHLASDSPCIGQGMAVSASSTDIDGQPWANLLPIGCDEWRPQLLLVAQPRVVIGRVSGETVMEAQFAGLADYCWWTKDGVPIEDNNHYTSAHSTRLTITNFNIADRGDYQIIASNSFGVVTSAVVKVNISCVDRANFTPAPPYTNWTSAAVTIQDAIDAAPSGSIVLVTNGVYSTGGRLVSGDMTNRVVLDKALTVLSVSGPGQTIIEGAWDPVSTNGPLSVRCAWVGEGALLGGFTLQGGSSLANGGGVLSSGPGLEETVVNCVITNCRAAGDGGGAYGGRLRECIVVGNEAPGSGGGAAFSMLDKSLIQSNAVHSRGGGLFSSIARASLILNNTSSHFGGGSSGSGLTSVLIGCVVAGNTAVNQAGAEGSTLYQCNVVSNTATIGPTGGVDFCDAWNSIIYFNFGVSNAIAGARTVNAGGSSTYHSVCTFPTKFSGSFTNDPQLLDAFHIAITSPCRGAGTNIGPAGILDIDKEPWLNPASIGCDEVIESELVGPLNIALSGWSEVAAGGRFPLGVSINGRASRWNVDFADSTIVSNSVFGVTHVWTNAGDYQVVARAFNNDYPQGVTASLAVHVVPVVNPNIVSTMKSVSQFSAQFLSQPGLAYELHSTTNLEPPILWQVLQSLTTSTGGVVTVVDTNTSSDKRFYRLKIQ
jgi:hypothetical protein